ncbi:3-hydroxyacyl-CoA dehydrogenase NAD-binding domain-containing protein [Bdellovibrio sp. KM01]|uniref:3-hydroxyacyl-CoA dehydrogenase NAD-binding domain-containing protein n=1 Tax=Bdellovibrio sp. KM01 TaxID=2748865 RepID=UPI0015EA1D1F|nr:3-hydroxyacyl-CoA dehydrogenase NAD-binding domain-containing protein [Bdellovibrio sp. KM01]QLY23910.1 enoyl-CoA hydratase/isomerase family protein [Bdellovibrio sp. KM01]
MSMLESIRINPQGEIAVVEFDLVGEKVNKFSTPVMMRLKDVVEELRKSSFKAVIFKSMKPKIFIAGADIEEIKGMTTKEQFNDAVKAGQEIMNMVEDLPMPTFASVNGACMGGGCEFIMSCDYRIASDDSSTKIGLPEIQLGILPGFGGTQRMPRIMGLQASLDIILAGKAVNSKKALKSGLVDKVVHPNLLDEQAIKWAKEVIAAGGQKRRKKFQPQGLVNKVLEGPAKGIVFKKAREGVMKATKGHYPAPLKALDVIQKTYGMSDRDAGMRIEREGFCELGVTAESKNLIHVYYLTEMVKKQTGVSGVNVKPKDVKGLGILGAGTMGGGIAYVAADKGIQVRMKDLNPDALAKGLKHASDLWMKLVKRNSIDKYQFQQKIDAVSVTTDYSGFKNLDVVVEAIVEDMGIKQKVIGECAAQMRPDAIIATNTSSLSVTEMAKGHPRPEYFAGMHFFNPVNKMPLVEVIRGEKTSDETIATIFELTKKMGKMPVVVKDGPGFLVNRLLLPYMAEAAWLMQEGMSIEVVDKAYVKDFGMPMGPFELMDEVGLDVCIKVLKIFKKAFGERIEMAPCMEALEKSGRLGRKNGKGFYTYQADGKRGDVDQTVYGALGLGSPSNPLQPKECIERGVFAMVNECSLALIEDHIVELPHEVDLGMIMGTGFPPFRGGLLKYADSIGSQYIADQLATYASSRNAKRLKPATPLANMAKSNAKFYK